MALRLPVPGADPAGLSLLIGGVYRLALASVRFSAPQLVTFQAVLERTARVSPLPSFATLMGSLSPASRIARSISSTMIGDFATRPPPWLCFVAGPPARAIEAPLRQVDVHAREDLAFGRRRLRRIVPVA